MNSEFSRSKITNDKINSTSNHMANNDIKNALNSPLGNNIGLHNTNSLHSIKIKKGSKHLKRESSISNSESSRLSENKLEEKLIGENFINYNIGENYGQNMNLNVLAILKSKEMELLDKSKENEKLRSKLDSTKNDLYEKRIAYEKLKLDFEMNNKKYSSYDKILQDKTEEISYLNQCLDKKDEELEGLNSFLSKVEENMRGLDLENKKLHDKLGEAFKILNEKDNYIYSIQVQSEYQDKHNNELLKEIEYLKNELTEINKNMNSKKEWEESENEKRLMEKINEMKSQFNKETENFQNVINGLKEENEKLRYELQEKTINMMALDDKRNIIEIEFNQINDKLNKEKEKVKKILNENQKIIQEFEEQLNEKDKVIAYNLEVYEKEEKALNVKISDYEKQAMHIKEEIMKYSKNSVILTDKNKDSFNIIAEREGRIKSLKDENKKLNSDIQDLKKQINDLEEKMIEENKSKENSITELEKEKEQLNLLCNELKLVLNENEVELNNRKQYIDEILEEGKIHKKENKETNAKMHKLREKNGELEGIIKSLNTELILQRNNFLTVKKKYSQKLEKVSSYFS